MMTMETITGAYLSPGKRGLLFSKLLTFSGCILSSSARMHPTKSRKIMKLTIQEKISAALQKIKRNC